MQVATSKTREQYPLSKKKIIKKTVVSMIAWLILVVILAGCALFGFLGDSTTTTFALVGLLTLLLLSVFLFAVDYWYQTMYFATYFYDLTDDYVIIRKGVWAAREITIPYERIQDVYVDQDIVDRMMGLFDVHLSTATISSGMNAHIDGVESQAADGLRSILLNKVQERVGRKNAPDSK